jgi:hypothetical protein
MMTSINGVRHNYGPSLCLYGLGHDSETKAQHQEAFENTGKSEVAHTSTLLEIRSNKQT